VSPLRIAVAGAGLMGRSHAQLLVDHAQTRLAAFVDPAAHGQSLAQGFGVPCHASLDELLARDKPDALIIATPNDLHVPQALQALAQGLPVLLEKPVSTTVAQGQRLLDAVQATGARVLVGHHRAHSPIMAKAREVVQSGRLGRLVAVQGSATFYKPERYFADGPWRAAPGGGPILINMIHEVHNLRMLCGEIAAVQAFASNSVRGFSVEDSAVINLRFDSGVLGSFVLSDTAASARSWEQTSQENKAYPSYGDEDCYVLSGSLGTLAVPTMRLKTYADAQQASWWLPFELGAVDLVREDPLQRQLDHFVQIILGQAEPLVSVRDGLQNLRVIEAIAQAVRTGQAVQIS
jgi:predicted dehydrogenase